MVGLNPKVTTGTGKVYCSTWLGAELQIYYGYNSLSVSSTTVILAVAGFKVTSGSLDIRARLKYSRSSTAISLRMGTITV